MRPTPYHSLPRHLLPLNLKSLLELLSAYTSLVNLYAAKLNSLKSQDGSGED